MGLGSVADVTLKAARDAANQQRALVRTNVDPIKARAKQRREAASSLHCLREIAVDAFESRKAELKSDGLAGRWFSPLEIHVLPKFDKLPLREITQIDVRDVLAPLWHTNADTARKALNRLSIVLRHAAALGLKVDLQACDKAKALFGKTQHKAENIPAMA